MKPLLRAIAIALFCTTQCAIAETEVEPSVVGLWKVESASFEVPEQCKQNGQYIRFGDDGTSVTNDGSLATKGTYRLAKCGDTLFMYTTYLSDNGKANCQGLSAKYVKKHQPKRVPIRFIDDGKRVQVCLGENETAPHLTLAKVK